MQTACRVAEQGPLASPAPAEYQVICVCGGLGFPFGTGSASRIIMVGKALQREGIGFRLIHCGPSPVAANSKRSGVFEDIPFEYTTAVRRPENVLARSALYLRALPGLTLRLARLRAARRDTAIWLYILDGPLNLYVGLVCRLLGLPVVQELCEWWPGEPTCTAFTRWLYRRRLFRNARGALVISKLIEQRVRDVATAVSPQFQVYRLPSVVDPHRFIAARKPAPAVPREKSCFLWCGSVDGWQNDVRFLVRAAAILRSQGHKAEFLIVGTCSKRVRAEIIRFAQDHGLAPEEFVLTGHVDDRTLEDAYRSATALLLPLRNDDRSRTRMPNKLAEYLASGRPVVTCKVGDLTELLTDGVNAYLANPGEEESFAKQMMEVVRDPARADRIGAAGQNVCLAHFDYRAHSTALARFFVECMAVAK